MPVKSVSDKFEFVKKYEEIQNLCKSIKNLAAQLELKKQELKAMSDYSAGLADEEKAELDLPLIDVIAQQ